MWTTHRVMQMCLFMNAEVIFWRSQIGRLHSCRDPLPWERTHRRAQGHTDTQTLTHTHTRPTPRVTKRPQTRKPNHSVESQQVGDVVYYWVSLSRVQRSFAVKCVARLEPQHQQHDEMRDDLLRGDPFHQCPKSSVHHFLSQRNEDSVFQRTPRPSLNPPFDVQIAL